MMKENLLAIDPTAATTNVSLDMVLSEWEPDSECYTVQKL